MASVRRAVWLALTGSILILGAHSTALGQFFVSSRYELSDAVAVESVDSTARTHLEQVKSCLADRQWDEAVETLQKVMENHGGKVIELAPGRFVGLREFCHLKIATLPLPALELYRGRVDAQAKRLFDKALAARDADGLRQLADRHFCSSWADDALFALGEIMLEQGDCPAARDCWERLIETPQRSLPAAAFDAARQAEGLPADKARLLDDCYALMDTVEPPLRILKKRLTDDEARQLIDFWNAQGLQPKQLAYPRTNLDLATIRARLVLVSIMEGSLKRAADDLAAFNELHPQAQGKLGGKAGTFGELLASLLESSRDWPVVRQADAWTTFAGTPARNFVAPPVTTLGELAWKFPLERQSVADARISSNFGYSPRRFGESNEELLSYHPLIVGKVVLFANASRVYALNVETGKPAWGQEDGAIFKEADDGVVRPHMRHSSLGAPRFTLTVHGDMLFARMGSSVTCTVADSPFTSGRGSLVCLDLARQGSLKWRIDQEDDKWAFEGTPVCDGVNVYAAMRRSSDVKPQAHVACFDAETGGRRWRRFVCAAQTPGQGMVNEITHNLLTLHEGTLYVNSNLGGVAAIDARDGQIKWLSLYARARKGDLNNPAAHYYRDLNPCIYDRGRVIVAPADCVEIMAFNAQTGALLWKTSPGQPEDVLHLLGVHQGQLVASGDRLWFIDAAEGKFVAPPWPEGPADKGFGRGVLAGNEVLWPTRKEIIRFDLSTRSRLGTIDVENRGAQCGNLHASDDCLLIAGCDWLYAFSRYGQRPETKQQITKLTVPISPVRLRRAPPILQPLTLIEP